MHIKRITNNATYLKVNIYNNLKYILSSILKEPNVFKLHVITVIW